MEHLIAKALKAYNETFGIDEMEEEFRDQDDKNYRGVVAELMVSFHEKQLAALPNGLPDDEAIEDESGNWCLDSKEPFIGGAKWMRSLAEKDISRLKEAAKNLLSLHAAEMEGIILPTKEQWFKAVTELEKEAYRESCK